MLEPDGFCIWCQYPEAFGVDGKGCKEGDRVEFFSQTKIAVFLRNRLDTRDNCEGNPLYQNGNRKNQVLDPGWIAGWC